MTDKHTPGRQAMVACGLKPDRSGFYTKPKECLLCKAPSVFIDVDDAQQRIMSCDECGAVEIITKNKTSWWYHGARMPHEWPRAASAKAEG